MDKDQVYQAQRRRRDFIRAHHPDRGGDPDAFIAGLQSIAADLQSLTDLQSCAAGPDLEPLPPVVVVRRLSWPARLAIVVAQRLRHGRKPPRVH